jgi:NAD(P)-dependent dehydrogenase (short-subunit alcohol dehydrogenase family)
MKSVVVTGVSSGIGHAATVALTRRGFHVFGSVRSIADADRFTATFGGAVTPLVFDVTDRAAIERAASLVRDRLAGRTLIGLVNNAGVAVVGSLLDVRLADFEAQLAVNVTGPLSMIQVFAPLLGVDRFLKGAPGRIINVSSVSGIVAVPFFGPYTASKYALEALSDTLRRELTVYGIHVVTINPGFIETPFYDKTARAASAPPPDSPLSAAAAALEKDAAKRRRSALAPEAVAAVMLSALTATRPKRRYVVVPNRWTDWIVPRLLPPSIADWLICSRLRLTRPAPGKGR